MRSEMERRFGDAATIEYIDTSDAATRAAHAKTVDEIGERGLIYPVTVIDGVPLYDGAVSYPAILRAIESRLTEQAG